MQKSYFILFIFLLVFSNTSYSYAEEASITEIHIDLWNNKLYLIKDDKRTAQYPIATGKDETPTPIGQFHITKKQKDWGSGFGTRWMELDVPWGQYGIHGTSSPHSIGESTSNGCIRMHNKDVEELYAKVPVDTLVTIVGPITGQGEWSFRNLSVGSKGTLVMLVQNHLHAAGFYDGSQDGIYGKELEKAVTQFQKEHHLKPTGGVTKKMYLKLGILE